MKKIKKKTEMKWYNFLICFWLPLNIVAKVIIAVLGAGLLFFVVKSSIESRTFNFSLILTVAYLLLVTLITLVYICGLRGSLKKLESKASKLLVIWYLLPILFNIGLLFVTKPLWPTEGDFVQYVPLAFLALVIAAFARAFFMILLNVPYFLKREELFDHIVSIAGEDISSYIPRED